MDAWAIQIAWWRRCVVCLCGAALLAVGLSASPAQGASCQYADVHHSHDGYSTSLDSGRMGAQGWIVTQQGDLCSSGTKARFWNAWVMVAGTGIEYAQAGYIKFTAAGGIVRYFAQSYDEGENLPLNTWYSSGSINYGTNMFYKAYMDWNSAVAVMGVGPFNVSYSYFNPSQTWSGSHSEWYAETDDPKTMVPGTSGARAGFTGLEELQYLGPWTASIPSPFWSTNANPADWNRSSFIYCLDGHRCFEVWHD